MANPRLLYLPAAMQVMREHDATSRAKYRALAQSFTQSGWRLPEDPEAHYGQEFPGWRVFLGQAEPKPSSAASFAQVRRALRTAGIASAAQYRQVRAQGALPEDFPEDPETHYGLQWPGWAAFAPDKSEGKSPDKSKPALRGRAKATPAPKWLSLPRAMRLMRMHGVETRTQYQALAAQFDAPEGRLPPRPEVHYGQEFPGWDAFVGANEASTPDKVPKRSFVSYEQAQALVRTAGITSRAQFLAARTAGKLPGVPSNPANRYAEQWTTWPAFLGTPERRRVAADQVLSFEQARTLARAQGMRTRADWVLWFTGPDFPPEMPRSPDFVYRGKGWAGWPDFLGTAEAQAPRPGRASGKRPQGAPVASFERARRYVRELQLRSQVDYARWAASGGRPADIPKSPARVYADQGWAGWPDFLGTSRFKPARRDRVGAEPPEAFPNLRYLPLHIAQRELAALRADPEAGLVLGCAQHYWQALVDARLPAGLPARPDVTYAEYGWPGWAQFLGVESLETDQADQASALPELVQGVWLPFEQARHYVRTLGLTTRLQWLQFAASERRPEYIPAEPWKVYMGQGFKGIEDFLGAAR